MLLKILLPAEVMMVEEVKKIVAEAEDGSFCLMPNHIDFVATLAPGIFSYILATAVRNYWRWMSARW